MDVFIVEEADGKRAKLQSVLSDMSGIKVVGQAVDEAESLKHINALQPEVVILSLSLQSGSVFRLLKHIKGSPSEIKVIVFSHYIDQACIDHCKYAGADYFFDKSFQLMQLREILWKWTHTDRLDNQFRHDRKFDVFKQPM